MGFSHSANENVHGTWYMVLAIVTVTMMALLSNWLVFPLIMMWSWHPTPGCQLHNAMKTCAEKTFLLSVYSAQAFITLFSSHLVLSLKNCNRGIWKIGHITKCNCLIIDWGRLTDWLTLTPIHFQCTTVGFWESLATPVKVYNGGDTGYLDDAYLDERYLDNVHLDDGYVNDGYLDDGYLDNGHLDSVQNSSGHLYSGQYDQPLRLAGLRCFHQKYQNVCKKEYLQLCVDKNTKKCNNKKTTKHFVSAPLTGRTCTTRCTTVRSLSSPLPSSLPPTSRYICFWKGGCLFSVLALFCLSYDVTLHCTETFLSSFIIASGNLPPFSRYVCFWKVAVTLTPEDEKRSYQSLASRSSEKLDGVCVHVLMG